MPELRHRAPSPAAFGRHIGVAFSLAIASVAVVGQGCGRCAGEGEADGVSRPASEAVAPPGVPGAPREAPGVPTATDAQARGGPAPVDVVDRARVDLKDPDPQVREAAFRTLEYAATAEADRVLAEVVLGEGDEEDRLRAMIAIEETAGREGIDALGQVLGRESSAPRVKRAAIDALEVIGNELAARALAIGLEDPNPEVRIDVANALDFMEEPAVVDDLWRAYRSETDDFVRSHIVDALDSLGQDVERMQE